MKIDEDTEIKPFDINLFKVVLTDTLAWGGRHCPEIAKALQLESAQLMQTPVAFLAHPGLSSPTVLI